MSEKFVGFSRVEIKPGYGIEMTGYFEKRFATGTYDPIELQGVAFRENEETAVFIVSDTLGLLSPLAYELPVIVGNEVGVPSDNVLICHTHTHTGPHIDSYRIPGDPVFIEHYKKCLVECARLAVEDLKKLKETRLGEGSVPHMTAPRRFKMKNGTYRTWGINGDPEIVSYACKTDESFRIIRYIRESGPEVVLMNFQCHPDCVGGTLYSSDFPGAFRRAIEEENPNAKAVFINGAEGQMIGPDLMSGILKPKCIERAYRMGQRLADFAQPVYLSSHRIADTTPLKCGRIKIKAKTKYDPDRYDECLKIIKNHEEGNWELNGPTKADDLYVVSEAYVIKDLVDRKIETVDIIMSFLCFNGVALVGIPGEPFCELGIQIRAGSPYPVTCIACHCNGSEAYYPTAESYDQGGYEPSNCRFVKGTMEKMVESCLNKLNKIHEL